MNGLIKPRIRCAVYTRKSSEDGLEQEYNSLGAQHDSCEAYITSHLIQALLCAHKWQKIIDANKVRTAEELAEKMGISHTYVCRVLRLNLLAPDIKRALLDGRQPIVSDRNGLSRFRLWNMGARLFCLGREKDGTGKRGSFSSAARIQSSERFNEKEKRINAFIVSGKNLTRSFF